MSLPISTLPGNPADHCRNVIFRARYELRTWCGRRSPIFTPLYGWKPFNRRHLVQPNTGLCIEGFPRSANSYTVLRIVAAQRPRVPVAHHLHVPAQLQRAARWNIPTLVLARHPRDAVASLLIRHPELSMNQALRSYAWFYRAILPLRDAFVLAEFEDVIRDLAPAVAALNARFGTTFRPPPLQGEADEGIFRALERINHIQGRTRGEHAVSRPSLERARRKQQILHQFATGRPARLLAAAEASYERILTVCRERERRAA